MKGFRKLLAVVLAAAVLVGIGTPLQTKAATKPTVKSIKVDEVGSDYAYLSVSTKGSGSTQQYQYQVYVNGKLSKKGYSNYYTVSGSNKRYCRVEIPAYSACTVRVKVQRGGVWSSWSKYAAIVPAVKITGATSTGYSFTMKWKKMKGATDYVLYTRKSGTSKWIKQKTVKGTSAKVGTSSYPFNVYYDIRVIARKKVNGKYTGSKTWSVYEYHRYKY